MPSRAAASPSIEAAVARLRTAAAVRERCAQVLAAAERDGLAHFAFAEPRLDAAAEYVARVIRERHPDLAIPMHSRWRHFAAGGRDRWRTLAETLEDRHERARVRVELAVVSVLLDAGAGDAWRYREPATGAVLARSEGLAVASLDAYAVGAFSAEPGAPLRVDAERLAAMGEGDLAALFQVGPDNPLAGLAGRRALLARLGAVAQAQPAVFGAERPRIGALYDHLAAMARGGAIGADTLLETLLTVFADIWPGRLSLGDANLGDVWRHEAVRADDASDGLVPFHKLSQWLAYSLIEPLEEAGVAVVGLDRLTGLAEYRNGGLVVDLGVVTPRRQGVLGGAFPPDHPVIVEWRALTVALIDRLAPLVRARLGVDAAGLPLVRLLEGGTWAAGRRLAAERRPGAAPPIGLASDGTVL